DRVRGATGAVVLVDTRRIEDSFAAVDFFEARGLPFLVAVNRFPDAPRFPVAELREALSVRPIVPIVDIDARNAMEVRQALAAVTEYAIQRLAAQRREQPVGQAWGCCRGELLLHGLLGPRPGGAGLGGRRPGRPDLRAPVDRIGDPEVPAGLAGGRRGVPRWCRHLAGGLRLDARRGPHRRRPDPLRVRPADHRGVIAVAAVLGG